MSSRNCLIGKSWAYEDRGASETSRRKHNRFSSLCPLRLICEALFDLYVTWKVEQWILTWKALGRRPWRGL